MLATYIHTIHTQFQSNIFIFGSAIVKNHVRVMSLFETQFLVFLIVVNKNEGHVWNPETKRDMTGMFFKVNFETGNLT